MKKAKIEFILSEKKKKIYSMQASVDGNHLVIVEEGNLSVFNLKTGEVIFSITCFHMPSDKFYIISKDFSLVAVHIKFNCLAVWNIKKNLKVFQVETENIMNNVASFSNDCRFIALGFEDDYIEIWNIESRCKEYSLMKVMRSVRGIYFTKDDLSIIIVVRNDIQPITSIWSTISKTLVFTIDDYKKIWINEDYIITEKFNIFKFLEHQRKI